MTKQTFIESVPDMDWLMSTHIPEHADKGFRTAILYGNEDCPEMVALWLEPSEEVMVDTPFAMVWFNPAYK